jgi:hypothetical protein
MPRNSDSYSLLLLDEHFWKWIDACNYNDSLLSSPDRDDCKLLLKRTLAVWPVLLKLLNSSQAAPRPPVWLPYVIRAADRLFLVARDIPMKTIRAHVDEILQKISDVESRANDLVEIQVEKEKQSFFSSYSAVKSEHHSATDYWTVWEPHVRQEAMDIIKKKLDEFQNLLTDRRRDLEKMHLDQLTIRDKWSEIRVRLHPERYEETGAWWGSMVRPTKDTLMSDYLHGLPEMLILSDSQLQQITSTPINLALRGLSRIHLNASAALNLSSGSQETGQIPWSILRSGCLDLLKELSLVVDRKKAYSPVVIASVNIIDILLRLLYCRDMTQFDEEEQSISARIVQARQEAERIASSLEPAALNPGLDPVVARFTADEKAECVQAAIRKVMEASRTRNETKRDDHMRAVIELQAKLNSLIAYKQTNYENPWETVWVSWRSVVGTNPQADDGRLPPPLQYQQSA